MNQKQRRTMLARRTCACISMDHACELIVDWRARCVLYLSNADPDQAPAHDRSPDRRGSFVSDDTRRSRVAPPDMTAKVRRRRAMLARKGTAGSPAPRVQVVGYDYDRPGANPGGGAPRWYLGDRVHLTLAGRAALGPS